MVQKRLDFVHVTKSPNAAIAQLDMKYSFSDYQHTEQTVNYIPQTFFSNKVHQVRLEAFHEPYANWQGSLGLQLSSGQFSAVDLTNLTKAIAVIPATKTDTVGLFLVEKSSWNAFDIRSGALAGGSKCFYQSR
jgi:iron complex outermembrane receptor protein